MRLYRVKQLKKYRSNPDKDSLPGCIGLGKPISIYSCSYCEFLKECAETLLHYAELYIVNKKKRLEVPGG